MNKDVASMNQSDRTPRFDQSLVFPDIDEATLARENATTSNSGTSPWNTYLRKVLPPVRPSGTSGRVRLIRI